ncbi:TolC family protein [Novosphingobium sp. 9]|uniref:TolC family protein n=1 Tax=Novosphingobium sp. 9 TaxID=2025349 RepID=UPI0021B68183|nr:TolC family protein [Novosphingobium sp. 9]
MFALAANSNAQAEALTQGAPAAPAQLPAPTGDPLAISEQDDPILALGRAAGTPDSFRAAIDAAVARNPALGEAEAAGTEAEAARREARAGLFPSATASLTSYKTLARDFANDPDNYLERLRATHRTDATLSVNQTLVDFGATSDRIGAASARLRAAAAGVDSAADDIALRTIAAWYDVFGYRTLLRLEKAYAAEIEARRGDLQERIRQGVSAETDVARLDSAAASIATGIAGYSRQLAQAEARFTQLTGSPPPADIGRAPLLGEIPDSADEARDAALAVPGVIGAQAQAKGARLDAKNARAGLLPQVQVGLDAGRYGIIENNSDYDVRARIGLSMRFGGGIGAKADQVEARALAADAKASRIREEAARDAAIAWSDQAALSDQIAALETAYIAARKSRDVIAERFRVEKGDLFDLLGANTAYVNAATAYIEALTQRDAAHYVLLSRTGQLLPTLGIDSRLQDNTP